MADDGCWLVKSEPDQYPFSKLVSDGKAVWDGIRNFEARKHLRAMKKGDLVLFYHTGSDKKIVGIARVLKEAYQDPSTTEDFSAVDLEPVKALDEPVTLASIKKHSILKNMPLVKRARLSVMPVTKKQLDTVMDAGAKKAKR